MGRDDHDHVAAVLLRRGLHEAELLDVFAEALQETETQLGTGLLATTEHDRDLDLVASLQEPYDVTLLGRVVVRVDLRAELHLLDDGEHLVLAALTRLLGRLVLELAVVHELGHRRPRHGGDLDQVEIAFLGQPERLADGNDAHLLAVRTDQSHLWDANPVVDARFCADGASSYALLWAATGAPQKRRALRIAQSPPPRLRRERLKERPLGAL